ncbi:chemotaxis protein CheW [Pseudodesulfovibrio cashew]|uniref:Chemotaxis protein CheW n=1 Tax=Pseudodesulfovibrio cashew TaxID=2678688 RepID=A0A6I6JIL3_9BACT|nr:chemotaxis protein CheW [Pseudodesulfovibrio cashew]QGY40798.1 chemotaxis protein CheW [Pseudodesulfovibrio cashew]
MSSFVYRDVTVPGSLRGIINYMVAVERYREELSNLGSQWDLLTILGQMSGTGTDMTGTRKGFMNLTSELLGQLGLETLKKTSQAIGAKAQVAVDIVIRNLFERTADIGFLATDNDIREFLEAVGRSEAEGDGDPREAMLAAMVDRFREYVAKYSVYFDIVLMDTGGNVVARLDQDSHMGRSDSPVIAEALSTSEDFVEYFGPSDLLPDAGDSLIYAYRVTETDDPASPVLGVLALCFRFQNEMEGVFKKLTNEGDWAVLLLLDRDGMVIASSDENHIRRGSAMELVLDEEYRVVRFAGREYLAKTCRTNGYEGFYGLGWYGHAMLPLEHAFDAESRNLAQRVDEKVLKAVMSDPRLFSEALRSIPVQADRIQAELERTVWNGNVRESDAQSKVLLWNISDAGSRTKSVFEKSIGNLHETVVSAILDDVEFQAALAVDIMDRNLYERANDCRWWALTTAFRRILSQPHKSEQDLESISSILAYINGLYTVYTNLFVYDAKGTILAVSNPKEKELVGRTLNTAWTSETLAIKSSQEYSVSQFEQTELYGGQHTYIYGASIADITHSKRVVGGIGIVFDSQPQFAAMLEDSLPRDENGSVCEGCFGIFADRKRKIISSTDQGHRVGDVLEIPEVFFSLDNEEKTSRIIEFQGQYYAVGACTSSGYREFKIRDNYVNDVVGLVFVPLAEISTQAVRNIRKRDVSMDVIRTRSGSEDCVEIASFYVGSKWLGINAKKVVEAIRLDKVTDIPGARPSLRGKVLFKDKVVPVIRIHSLVGMEYPEDESHLQIVIVRYDNGNQGMLGIVVDSLAEIPEVCNTRVDCSLSTLEGNGYTECLIKPDENSKRNDMLVVLDPDGLMRHLAQQGITPSKH